MYYGILAFTLGMAVLGFAILPATVYGSSNNQLVFPPDVKPYNLSYNEWSAKYWQWILSIPTDKNPMNDPTGQYCAIGQQGPVWFLIGTSGSVERSCSVPSGKAIFFVIFGGECSFNEYPQSKGVSELSKCAVDSNNGGSNSLSAEVDGMTIQNLDKYRFQSPPFNVTFPSNPQFGHCKDKCPTTSVADGWYIMLRPLSPGKHVVKFRGIHITSSIASDNFVSNALYHLNVV